MPESYLPSKEIREARNICRNRNFLVRQRTAVKNRIRDQAYRLGFAFTSYRKKNLALLREASPVLRILVSDLNNLDQQIFEMDMQISNSIQDNEYAKIIDTILALVNMEHYP
jgi:transposase